ncbi:MAG: hypothetical protein COA79_21920 [Planctomycetota bacterium]|nr:MAG: hypothetical protein COA79_21920 [Planctomycetota bacterium]
MKKKKILIIEDDEFIQNILAISLEVEGYEIVCANDGQTGFNQAVTDKFDLIITDLNMPNWNGMENIYGLNLVGCKSKIIVVSGYLNDAVIAELKDYKYVSEIINKPFDSHELIKKVNSILGEILIA